MTAVSLAEFLLARIAEDEAAAMGWPDDIDPLAPDGHVWRDPQGRAIYAPKSRALVECEAKRRIVVRLAAITEADLGCACDRCATLRDLALPYSDHADYREEWRP